MKVIEHPTKPIWQQVVDCQGYSGVKSGCGSKLEIVEDDLFRVDRQQNHLSSVTSAIAVIECPNCHAWTQVEYPQPDILPLYTEWPQAQDQYNLPGYYAARKPYAMRMVPENLDPMDKQHRYFMTARKSE